MILTGMVRLGRDPELKYTAGGDPVANLALAYNYGTKDNVTNRKPSQWVDASLWGKRAEALVPYLVKGMTLDVVVEDVHVHTYTKSDGSLGTSMRGKIIAIELGSAPQQQQQAAPAPRQAAPAARGAPPPRAAAPQQRQPVAEHFEDDDIPFD